MVALFEGAVVRFGIVEVGSTNTKACVYDDGKLVDLGSRFIAFKNGYAAEGKLRESDVVELFDFVKEVQGEVGEVFVFGTSIFRKIGEEELGEFSGRMREELGVEFRVVSADEESMYTVKSVMSGVDFSGRLAVVIGGGGSTEVAIVEGGEIVGHFCLDFGAMDITDRFSELKEDVVRGVEFEEILDYTMERVGEMDVQAEVLVLAGGDYIYFYETAGYEMERNELYEDERQPHLLRFEVADGYDRDVMGRSLEEIKARDPGNESWWDGARGMRFCMGAVARKVGAKYIVPTRINMLVGLAEELREGMGK